jgi:hypothetical protein
MMRFLLSVYYTVIFILVSVCTSLSAQSWSFVRERDGIRLYTSQDENSSFKSFYGETDFPGDFDKVSSLVGNPSNLDWWGDDVSDIKVLSYEKDKQIRYYLVYDVPWPFTDRDIVAEVQLSQDTVSGTRTVYARPLPNLVPLKASLIRVTNYWEKWTLQPLNNGMVHVSLEGYIDPAGDVPAWLYNMIVVDIPLRLLQEVRKRAQVKEM